MQRDSGGRGLEMLVGARSGVEGILARREAHVGLTSGARGAAEAAAVPEGLRRRRLGGEAQDLARLIEQRFTGLGEHDGRATNQMEIRRAFLAYRFKSPMKTYQSTGRWYARLDTVLNVVSLMAGVGTSLAASVSASMLYPIVLGLLVGLLQSLSQWLKPAQRSARRGVAAAGLRNEAWSLLQGRDRYRGKPECEAWSLFCDQVGRVEDREESEDREPARSSEAGAPHPA